MKLCTDERETESLSMTPPSLNLMLRQARGLDVFLSNERAWLNVILWENESVTA